LGERLLCKQEVIGSIPFTSTKSCGAGGFLPAGRTRQRTIELPSEHPVMGCRGVLLMTIVKKRVV
jgi:hypothetical protein